MDGDLTKLGPRIRICISRIATRLKADRYGKGSIASEHKPTDLYAPDPDGRTSIHALMFRELSRARKSWT
jgi:hypothetical protein